MRFDVERNSSSLGPYRQSRPKRMPGKRVLGLLFSAAHIAATANSPKIVSRSINFSICARLRTHAVFWRVAFRTLAMFCTGRQFFVRAIAASLVASEIPSQDKSALLLPHRATTRVEKSPARLLKSRILAPITAGLLKLVSKFSSPLCPTLVCRRAWNSMRPGTNSSASIMFFDQRTFIAGIFHWRST